MSDIIRRDPRAEWIARNRLHPLHAAMQPAQHSWMGPNGVIRKNLHGIGFIGPNGIKRIDRSGAQQGGATKRTAAVEVQLPLHQVPAPAFYICVVPDMVGGRLGSHDRDLLGLAHQLAGKDGAVLAVVFGEHKESAFATAGVDRLLVLEGVVEPRPLIKDIAELVADALLEDATPGKPSAPAKREPAEVH